MMLDLGERGSVVDSIVPRRTAGNGTDDLRGRIRLGGVGGWTGLRGRSALQILGSAAAALDLLPRGAEQAACGDSCG